MEATNAKGETVNLEERRERLRELERVGNAMTDREVAKAYLEKAAEEREAITELEKVAGIDTAQLRNLAKAATMVRRGGVAADLIKAAIADAVKAVAVDEVTTELDKSDKRLNARLDGVEARVFGRPAPPAARVAPPPVSEPTSAEKAADFRRIAGKAQTRELMDVYLAKAVEEDAKALDPSAPGSGVAIMRAIESHLSKATLYDAAAGKAQSALDAQQLRSMARSEREAATEMRSNFDKGAK